MKPLAIDLFCGLGGWAEGLLQEGYRVIGFDIERHQYGDEKYPAELVLQDVLTLHGSQFRDAALIVASPPCQAYSYRAMPWSRLRDAMLVQHSTWEDEGGPVFDHPISNPPIDNGLLWACFRIQREASEAAGRWIPLIVENVKGAQPWVGRAAWHYGSFYLWGDVPALMIPAAKAFKTIGHVNKRDGHSHTRHLTNQRESDGVKQHGSGAAWFDNGLCKVSSDSLSRKAASARIAKIPLPLATHIARCFSNA